MRKTRPTTNDLDFRGGDESWGPACSGQFPAEVDLGSDELTASTIREPGDGRDASRPSELTQQPKEWRSTPETARVQMRDSGQPDVAVEPTGTRTSAMDPVVLLPAVGRGV